MSTPIQKALAFDVQVSLLAEQIYCRGVQAKRRLIKGMVQQKKKNPFAQFSTNVVQEPRHAWCLTFFLFCTRSMKVCLTQNFHYLLAFINQKKKKPRQSLSFFYSDIHGLYTKVCFVSVYQCFSEYSACVRTTGCTRRSVRRSSLVLQ